MARGRTGKGQFLDIALSDGVLYLHANIATRYFRDGFVPKPGNWLLNGGSPAYNVYACKNGQYISIACVEPRFWRSLCEAIGRPDLSEALADPQRNATTAAELANTFATRTRDEWWSLLRPLDAMSGAPVLGLDEALEDAHHGARGMVADVGRVDGEPVRQIGVARLFSDTPASIRSLAPTPGQHTDEVLAELGYSAAERDALRNASAVG